MWSAEQNQVQLAGLQSGAGDELKMEHGAKLHLKEWLVAQIESGRFEGLSWEDEDRTMFRIPWKHAAKKDYKQTEDAALFKVRAACGARTNFCFF